MFIWPLLRTLPYASLVSIGVIAPIAVRIAPLIKIIAWSETDLDRAI